MSLPPSTVTVFRGVRVFDGRGPALTGPSDVVVRGTTIESVGPAVAEQAPAGPVVRVAMTADPGYVHLVAGKEAERTLLRGFTSVRDAGGPAFGLKRAIDEGLVAGPRIYPSGAFITQTAGHGDFRPRHEVPRACGNLSNLEV